MWCSDRKPLEQTPNAEVLGICPMITGTKLTHEGLYVNQRGAWRDTLLRGLEAKINGAKGKP
jgi:anthranilate 1,2-dioxygenase (deaminating, decarboxylating) large subunit